MSDIFDVSAGKIRQLTTDDLAGLGGGGGSGSGGITDSTGASFSPDACAHTYAYTSGLLTTDTATDGVSTWVKTYTYTSGVLSAESKWVKQ